MCLFVLATIPQHAALDELEPAIERCGLRFDTLANPHLLSQLEDGERLFLTTRGHCDCGTGLASHAAHRRRSKVEALERKGWSDGKIRRWIGQVEDADRRAHAQREAHDQESTPDLVYWVAFLHEAVAAPSTPHLGLLVHSFAGHDLTGDAFRIRGMERVGIEEVDEGRLDAMRRDVLYRFERRAAER